jgi:hypothetical protein
LERLKRKALGYVYGYIDAALRTKGHDMADMSIGVPITFQVIRRLWPDHVNECMDFLAKNLRSDALMSAGIMHGGQQFLDYSKPGASGAPMTAFNESWRIRSNSLKRCPSPPEKTSVGISITSRRR